MVYHGVISLGTGSKDGMVLKLMLTNYTSSGKLVAVGHFVRLVACVSAGWLS